MRNSHIKCSNCNKLFTVVKYYKEYEVNHMSSAYEECKIKTLTSCPFCGCKIKLNEETKIKELK